MCAKHVIQLDYPKNPIDYALRVGRVGRLGQDGVVTNFIKKTDRELFNQIQSAENNLDEIIRKYKRKTIV